MQGLPVRELLQHAYLIRRRQLLREALLFAGFIGIFFAVCFTIYDVGKAFQTNDAFIDLFLDEEFADANYKKVSDLPRWWGQCSYGTRLLSPANELIHGFGVPHFSQNFYEIMTVEELWTWLKGPVINGAYQTEWYNGEPFSPLEQGLVLYSSRLVGGVQLRQMRVRGDTCKLNDPERFLFPGESSTCFGAFRLGIDSGQGTDDRSPHGQGGEFRWTDGHHFLDGLNGYGPSYGTGGYITQLPPNRTEAVLLLQSLEDGRWIDQGSRAVMVMMNFFNKQTYLVTVVRLLIEIFPSGHLVKSFKFYSYQAGLYDGPLGQGRIVFELLLVVGLVYFVGKEVRQMYLAPSVTHYMRSPGNAFEVTMYILVVVCMIYYFLFLLAPDRNSFQVADNVFRDIFAVAERYVYIFTLAGFIGLLFTLKLFRYFSVSLQMQALFNTMMRAAPDLMAFMFGFVVLVSGFAFSGSMLWGSTLAEYHNMASAFASLLRLSLGDFDYARLAAAQPVVTGWFFALYVTIVYLIAMNILIAIVTMYFEEVTRLLKQEEAWKQALPGFDSEILAWLVESLRPGCSCCCRICHKAGASSVRGGCTMTCTGSRADFARAMAPRSQMREAELLFDEQLAIIMEVVERQRGRSLESFMRAIYFERGAGEQLHVSASELSKLCSNPGGPSADANMLRRCSRRCFPCFINSATGTCEPISCRRGTETHCSGRRDNPIEKLLVLYTKLKLVTLVGRPKSHEYALDTFNNVVDAHSDWSFEESAMSPTRSRVRDTAKVQTDNMGRPWFTVKKINNRGLMQTRQLVIHIAKDGTNGFLLNYDRQGFLKRRMDLTTLAQVELVSTDPRVLGLLFLGFEESTNPGVSLLVDSKDRYLLVVFEDEAHRTSFVDALHPVVDKVMEHALGGVAGAPASGSYRRSPSSRALGDIAKAAQAITRGAKEAITDLDHKLVSSPRLPHLSMVAGETAGLVRPRARMKPHIVARASCVAAMLASVPSTTDENNPKE